MTFLQLSSGAMLAGIFRETKMQLNYSISNSPIAGIPLASFCFYHLFEFATLDINRGARVLLLLLFGFFFEHFDFVLQTGEDQTDHRGSTVQGITCVKPLVEWANLTFVALELHTLGVAWHLLPLDECSLDLLVEFARLRLQRDVLQLWILSFEGVFV